MSKNADEFMNKGDAMLADKKASSEQHKVWPIRVSCVVVLCKYYCCDDCDASGRLFSWSPLSLLERCARFWGHVHHLRHVYHLEFVSGNFGSAVWVAMDTPI